ncbi:MAG: alpha/beta hydrolase [Acidimicrobiia bacterium]|nr:alpha/beta hydrolase [Acidimicrobiia bacterium]
MAFSSCADPRRSTHLPRPRAVASTASPVQVALVALLAVGVLTAAWASTADAADEGDGVEARENISYGPEREQRLDVFLPAPDDRNGAAVVLVHGGGWSTGNRWSMRPSARRLAAGGFVTVTIDYRLVGETGSPFPDAVLDVQRAVAWLADHAATYQVDPSKIGMVGSSAGGHLAAMVATLGTEGDPTAEPLATEPAGDRVGAVATWSGIFDLSALAPGNDTKAACGDDPECLTLTFPDMLSNFLGCTLDECPGRYREASPIDHVGDETAPMFIANSTEELIPLSQPDAMIGKLSAHGVTESHQFVPGKAHAAQYTDKVWSNTESFLRNQLGVAGPDLADWLVPSTLAVLFIAALMAVAVHERRRHEAATRDTTAAGMTTRT